MYNSLINKYKSSGYTHRCYQWQHSSPFTATIHTPLGSLFCHGQLCFKWQKFDNFLSKKKPLRLVHWLLLGLSNRQLFPWIYLYTGASQMKVCSEKKKEKDTVQQRWGWQRGEWKGNGCGYPYIVLKQTGTNKPQTTQKGYTRNTERRLSRWKARGQSVTYF